MGTVDDYLTSLDDNDRAVVAHLYELALEVVPEAEQGLGYGMPALVHRGRPLLSVMRTKKHIGVYPFSPEAVDAARDLLTGYDTDKGTIRFQPDHPLPDAAVRGLLEARRTQIEG